MNVQNQPKITSYWDGCGMRAYDERGRDLGYL